MALLTVAAGSYVQVESLGSLKLMIIPLTTGSTSDTFSIGVGAPFVNAWVTGNSTSAGTSNGGDATYSNTTGLITIVSANQGSIDLMVLMRT
jgi:hypothetical protein